MRTSAQRTTTLQLDDVDLRRFWADEAGSGRWTTVLDEATGVLWDLTWVERPGDEPGPPGYVAHARVSLLNSP